MSIDIIFKIAAIGILVTLISQLLTRWGREDIAMITTVAGLIIVLLILLPHPITQETEIHIMHNKTITFFILFLLFLWNKLKHRISLRSHTHKETFSKI